MMIIEIIMEIADLFVSWRFYVCVVPAVLLAVLVHNSWPGAVWPWFVTVPLVSGAVIGGFWWDCRSPSWRSW
jgi:hypothetical protein